MLKMQCTEKQETEVREAYFVLIRLLVRVSIILLQKDFIVRYCIMNMEEPHQLLFLYPTGLTENE